MASSADVVEAGSDEYRDDHMAQIFQEGLSFSGFERDYLGLSLGPPISGAEPGSAATGRSESHRGSVTYLDISGVSGIDSISDGRGAAFADFDNDGDTDVFRVALQGTAHYLFRNNVGNDNNFLRVELIGTDSGYDAYGAVVRVKTLAGVLTKVKAGGSGFLAQHDPRLLFGLGADPAVEWLEVTWPSGATQRLELIAANTSLRVHEPGAPRVAAAPGTPPRAPSRTRVEHRTAGGFELVTEHRFSLVDPLGAEDALLAKLTLERGGPFPDLALIAPPGSGGPAPDTRAAEKARAAAAERRADPDRAAAAGPNVASLYDLLRPGRRTLINLWATWCIPCRKEMPELEQMNAELDNASIDLVGISIDTEARAAVLPFAQGVGATYPIFIADDPRIPEIYRGGEVFIPMSVLLDDSGRVLRVFGGWSPQTAAALRALVR